MQYVKVQLPECQNLVNGWQSFFAVCQSSSAGCHSSVAWMSKFSCLNVTNLFYQKLSGFSCKIFRLNEECILNRGTRLYICWKLHFSVDLPFQPELNLELILKIKDFFYSNQIHLKHSFSHIWDSFNYHKITEIILSCLKQIFIKHTSNHVCKVRLQKCCQQVSNCGQISPENIAIKPVLP